MPAGHKIVLITGVTRGLGRAMVGEFVRLGHVVLGCGRSRKDIAQLQKQPVQPASLQRGIKIKREDPAPSVVRVNDSPDADTLVTVIKLVHKSAPPTREAGARP